MYSLVAFQAEGNVLVFISGKTSKYRKKGSHTNTLGHSLKMSLYYPIRQTLNNGNNNPRYFGFQEENFINSEKYANLQLIYGLCGNRLCGNFDMWHWKIRATVARIFQSCNISCTYLKVSEGYSKYKIETVTLIFSFTCSWHVLLHTTHVFYSSEFSWKLV